MSTLKPNEMKVSLTRQQKEAIGLLSVGTFLEYFDLMLYVHMAVLLNDIFFPPADPHTKKLLDAFAFCSTYLLRPFGAIVFGYIGDKIGKKIVVVITTLIMSGTCATMSMMPTYAQIGISASIIVTLIRMVQGLVATAEARGAEIYITETVPPPYQYFFVAVVTMGSALGTTFALGVASMFTSPVFENIPAWRGAFILGSIVALIGTVARVTLKESREFADKITAFKSKLASNSLVAKPEDDELINAQKVGTGVSIYYFFIQCARPPCFYCIYIYCSSILKNDAGFTSAEVIHQNFLVSIVDFLGIIGISLLSYKIQPLKILKWKLYLFFITVFGFLFADTTNWVHVFIFQSLAALFVFDHVPATPIFYKYFPVLQRFRYTSILSALAKLCTYFITSFGLVYITDALGYQGILAVFAPIGIAFFISVRYFEKLEQGSSRIGK